MAIKFLDGGTSLYEVLTRSPRKDISASDVKAPNVPLVFKKASCFSALVDERRKIFSLHVVMSF